MSDERIAQLTELARRVWPDEPYGGAYIVAYGDSAWVRVRPNEERLKVLGHPRALEALEGALLVLAGERPSVHEWAAKLAGDAIAAGDEGLDVQLARKAWCGRSAWVERLADEWEADALRRPVGLGSALLCECAAALRERAADVPDLVNTDRKLERLSARIAATLELADEWAKESNSLAHDHEGADYELGCAQGLAMCAASLRALMKGAP